MDPLINLLQSGLDGASSRQKALTNNIANINTPGYKRKDVDFLSTLNRQAKRNEKLNSGNANITLEITDDQHIAVSQSKKPFKNIHITNTSYRNDENNVDVEYEMAELAKNTLYYTTLAQQLSGKFKSLNNVIEKGGR